MGNAFPLKSHFLPHNEFAQTENKLLIGVFIFILKILNFSSFQSTHRIFPFFHPLIQHFGVGLWSVLFSGSSSKDIS